MMRCGTVTGSSTQPMHLYVPLHTSIYIYIYIGSPYLCWSFDLGINTKADAKTFVSNVRFHLIHLIRFDLY